MNDPISRPTLRDIATACGVSHTLVSRALRNHAGVAAGTRQHVVKVAEEMGYRPDPLVSVLLTRVRQRKELARSAALAWINTNDDESWWQDSDFDRPLLIGARRRAEELGFGLDEFWVNGEGLSGDRLDRILHPRNVRGVIMPNMQSSGRAAMVGLQWSKYAGALIGWPWPDAGWSRAASDFHGNLGLALRRPNEAGVERIGLFAQRGLGAFMSNQLLLGHYHHDQATRPARSRIPMLSPSEHLPMAGDEVSRWMDRHRPDVVICHDSRLLEAVQATGRRVPEDVGLVHLNIAPDVAGWAGVDADLSEVAAAAVDLVFGQLSRGEYGPPKVPKIVTTPGRWTDGWTWTAKAS